MAWANTQHFKRVCRRCDKVIGQCRCCDELDGRKQVILSICSECLSQLLEGDPTS